MPKFILQRDKEITSKVNLLPEELSKWIWNLLYGKVIYEIQKYSSYKSTVLIYRKPSVLLSEKDYFVITSFFDTEKNSKFDNYLILETVEKYYPNYRRTHSLPFYQIVLNFKEHPTSRYWHGDKIEWVNYHSDSDTDDSDENGGETVIEL